MFKWIIGLLIGCCSLLLASTIPSPIVIAGYFTCSLLALYGTKHTKQSLLKASLLIISGYLFGLSWSLIHASWRMSQQISEPHNNSVHIIEAEVDSLPVIYPEYCQFRAVVKDSDAQVLDSKSLLLKDYTNHCEYRLGETWHLTVKLKPIYGPVNRSGFDYEFYMFQQALDGKGYIKGSSLVAQTKPFSISNLRQGIYQDLIPFQSAGLLQALSIGDKGNISNQHKELIRTLGLSHLIAISGLHISIIAGLSFWLIFKIIAWLNVISRRQLLEPYQPALIVSCLVALL